MKRFFIMGLCFIIGLIVLAFCGEYYFSHHPADSEKIPAVVTDSHVLEAVENADKIFNFVKNWKEKNPRLKQSVTFYSPGRTHNGRIIIQQIEGAPDVQCAYKPKMGCQAELFTYQADCIKSIQVDSIKPMLMSHPDTCSITVSANDGSFELSIFEMTDGTWQKVCKAWDNEKGEKICNHLIKTQGWRSKLEL